MTYASNACHCGKHLDATDPHTDAVYDDNTKRYFCDVDCFRDWADEHFEDIVAFYEKMNVT